MSVNGLKIVVTGKFSRGRKDIEAELANAGADVTGSVSGKTELLVCGADAGSKLAKAQKLGLPIVDEAQMERMLAGESLAEVLSGDAKPGAKKKTAKKKAAKKKAVKKKTAKKAAEKPASGGSLDGLKVVVTGSFSKPRAEVKAALEKLGANVIGSLSSKTQLLVVGSRAGSKLEKAQRAGVPVTDEYGFGCLMKGESLEQILRYDVIVE